MSEPTETDAQIGRIRAVFAVAVYLIAGVSLLSLAHFLGVWMWVRVVFAVVMLYLIYDAAELYFQLRRWSREHAA